jgi:hypothetical protein
MKTIAKISCIVLDPITGIGGIPVVLENINKKIKLFFVPKQYLNQDDDLLTVEILSAYDGIVYIKLPSLVAKSSYNIYVSEEQLQDIIKVQDHFFSDSLYYSTTESSNLLDSDYPHYRLKRQFRLKIGDLFSCTFSCLEVFSSTRDCDSRRYISFKDFLNIRFDFVDTGNCSNLINGLCYYLSKNCEITVVNYNSQSIVCFGDIVETFVLTSLENLYPLRFNKMLGR